MNRQVMVQTHPKPTEEGSPSGSRQDSAAWTGGPSQPLRRVWSVELRLLRSLLQSLGNPCLTIVLWDGQQITPEEGPAVGRVTIRDRRTLWKLALNPLFQFGEAYSSGRLEVEGDLEELLTEVFQRFNRRRKAGTTLDQFLLRVRRPRGHSRRQSRQNIHHHYDIGNEFYQLWLDRHLVYTCAYFADRAWTLEQAQLAKMEHVCRKLRLQPGLRVLEAGSGWGTLALHMARQHGVNVKAFNISREQVEYARRQARLQGLHDRVEFVLDDWRAMSDECDIFVSVGMLEHVGLENYPRLGRVIDRCLRPTGRGLIHSIGQNYPRAFNPWTERRIFPGAYPPSLRQIMQIIEPYDFSVLDVENLRLHYAQTLTHWLDRYERSIDRVREMFDEEFVRAWRLYLTASIAGFKCGGLQLFQVLFARGGSNDICWTRDALYAPGLLDGIAPGTDG